MPLGYKALEVSRVELRRGGVLPIHLLDLQKQLWEAVDEVIIQESLFEPKTVEEVIG